MPYFIEDDSIDTRIKEYILEIVFETENEIVREGNQNTRNSSNQL